MSSSTQANKYKLIVTSVGTANATVVGILGSFINLPEKVLANRIYQAPSELLSGLSSEIAAQLQAQLQTAGLETMIMHQDEPFTPGQGNYEIALVINNVKQMPAIISQICQILGVDILSAQKIAFGSPAIMTGHISLATVQAIRQRFAPFEVEIDASQPTNALYDLYIFHYPPTVRSFVEATIHNVGGQIESNSLSDNKAPDNETPLAAIGLTHTQANLIWNKLQRTHVQARIINRDFQRFGIRLEEAHQHTAMIQYLSESTGMPESIAQKVLQNLPVVIHQNQTFTQMEATLADIAALNGRASATLLAFQYFSLEIEQLSDLPRTAQLIQNLGQIDSDTTLKTLAHLPAHFAGPLTKTQAQWLQYELKKIGAQTQLMVK